MNTTGADSSGELQIVPTAGQSGHKRGLSQAEIRQRREAAVKSGLFARSPEGNRRRSYRAGRLLNRLLTAFAEDGRPLTALQVPQARAWAQLEVLAQDAYAAVMAGEGGDKGWLKLLSVRRVQQPITLSLGMSPMATGHLARELAGAVRERESAELAKSLVRDYGPRRARQKGES